MKNKFIKKFFSHYNRSPRTVARVLETNFPQSNNLKFFNGMHTVKLIKTESEELNPNKVTYFEIESHKLIKGYLDSPKSKNLNLISPHPKLVKNISASYYHAVADDLAEIVYAHTLYPDAEIILNISSVEEFLNKPEWDFVKFFLDMLEDKKIKYTLIDVSKFEIIYIDNFAQLQFPFSSGAKLDLLFQFFQDGIDNKCKNPTKKVYVSRMFAPTRYETPESRNFSFPDDRRIDSHKEIEDFFYGLGFEIVYPEQFKSFKDQVEYFGSVKTLVSLTSSGISNAIFMNPGGTVIELSTPLIVQSPLVEQSVLDAWEIDARQFELDLNVLHEIHMFYHNLSLFKEHLYISIPNQFRSVEYIKNFIQKHPLLKKIFYDQ